MPRSTAFVVWIIAASVTLAAVLLAPHGAARAPAAGPSAPSPSPEGITLPTRPTLTLDAARQIADAALAEARRLDAGGAIAVVDDGGALVYLVRIDNTFPAASDVATRKARTAAIFRKPTKVFEDAVRNGRTTLVAVEPMTPLEGGIPIEVGGHVIGGVGVSGAHSSGEDVQIAAAGAAAAQSLTVASPGR